VCPIESHRICGLDLDDAVTAAACDPQDVTRNFCEAPLLDRDSRSDAGAQHGISVFFGQVIAPSGRWVCRHGWPHSLSGHLFHLFLRRHAPTGGSVVHEVESA
jgi:hypothetical protein